MDGESDGRSHWFVFAGGGTGGHLFPALSVAEALRRRDVPIDVSFCCTQRPIDKQLLGAAGIEAIPLTVQPFSTRPWHWPQFWLRWRESVSLCRRMFERRRPAAVVGAGGYASGPPVHAAMKLGIPTFLLNPDAVPGRANRYLAGRTGLTGVFVQWPVTSRYLPSDAPIQVVGCPVRPAFRAARQADRRAVLESFGLDPALRTLLVTGASQGARSINDAMMLLAERLDWTGWQVLHLAGQGDAERVADAYSRLAGGSASATLKSRVLPFTDQMAEAMVACDLIVSRAGASTLAEIQAVGRPSILLPYPYHRDQHQGHNGMVLVEAGAAVLVDDAKDGAINADRLGPVMAQLMADDARRTRMGQCAMTLDRPDSAQAIAAGLLAAAELGGCESSASKPVRFAQRRSA